MKIKCDVKKTMVLIIFTLIMLPLMAMFVIYDIRDYTEIPMFQNDIILYILKGFFAFSFVFFSIGLCFFIKTLIFNRKNIIEFHDTYMIDRSSYIAFGKIYYNDIEKIYLKGMFLCIKVKNEYSMLQNMNVIKRMFMIINKKMKYEYITITDNILETSIYEIKDIIEDKIKRVDFFE